MKLTGVNLYRNHRSELEGNLEILGSTGFIKLTLSELQASQILSFCGEALSNVARDCALALQKETERLVLAAPIDYADDLNNEVRDPKEPQPK